MIFIILFAFIFPANSADLLDDMYFVNNWELLETIESKKIYQSDCSINNDKYIMIEEQILGNDDYILNVIESVENYNNVLSNKNIKTELLFSKADTSIALQTISNAIPFTSDRKYIFKLYKHSENRIDWLLINNFDSSLLNSEEDSHILSFGAGSWEIKQKDYKKILIYRMYLDDEVNLPLMFIQKIRINQTVNIFNDVLTFSQGE